MDDFDLPPPPLTPVKTISALTRAPKIGDQVVVYRGDQKFVFRVYAIDYYGNDAAIQGLSATSPDRSVIFFRDCYVIINDE